MINTFHHQRKGIKTTLLSILLVTMLVSACTTPKVEVTQTETPQTSAEATATTAATATNTASPAPTITPVPTRVPPTATPELPVAVSTPLPLSNEIITVENAAELSALALYGRGTNEEIAISPSGRWVVVATISGISIYDTDNPDTEIRYLSNQSIRSIDVSANGDFLAAGLEDGRVMIMNLADGLILQQISAHEGAVLAIDIAPNDMLIASGDTNGLVKLWNTDTGAAISTFDDHTGRINDLTFSPDSKTLASGSVDQLVYLWDVQAGTRIDTLRGQNGSITTLEYTSTGQYLASGSADTSTYLWDLSVEDAIPYVLPNTNIVRDVAFSPNMQQIAIAGDNNQVIIWEIFDAEGAYQGYQTLSLPHNYIVKSIGYANENSLISATWGSVVNWWKLPERELVRTTDHGQLISSGYMNDRPYIISEPQMGDVMIYLADTGEEMITIEKAHNNNVYQAMLLDDGQTLLTVSYDGYRFWNMMTGEVIEEFVDNASFVTTLDVSADGAFLGIGWGNSAIDIVNLATFEISQSMTHGRGRVLTLDFSPDGSLIASGGDDTNIILWRLSDGRNLLNITGHQDVIYDVEFSPNGESIASASSDYTVRVWQSISGDEADWGKELDLFDDHDFRVKSVTFSPAGDLLASVSDDGTINVWNLSGGQRLQTLTGLTGFVKYIQFTPDGSLLFTDDWDGVMRIYGIAPIFN